MKKEQGFPVSRRDILRGVAASAGAALLAACGDNFTPLSSVNSATAAEPMAVVSQIDTARARTNRLLQLQQAGVRVEGPGALFMRLPQKDFTNETENILGATKETLAKTFHSLLSPWGNAQPAVRAAFTDIDSLQLQRGLFPGRGVAILTFPDKDWRMQVEFFRDSTGLKDLAIDPNQPVEKINAYIPLSKPNADIKWDPKTTIAHSLTGAIPAAFLTGKVMQYVNLLPILVGVGDARKFSDPGWSDGENEQGEAEKYTVAPKKGILPIPDERPVIDVGTRLPILSITRFVPTL